VTIFDQRGQAVKYQFNIAGDLKMSDVQSKQEAIDQLKKLQAEMGRAVEANVFDEDVATDAQYQVKKAVIEAQKPQPDKKTIADRLASAKTRSSIDCAPSSTVLTGYAVMKSRRSGLIVSGRVENRILSTWPSLINSVARSSNSLISSVFKPRKLPPKNEIWTGQRRSVLYLKNR